jgi:NitT/TauT family transport system permease protein
MSTQAQTLAGMPGESDLLQRLSTERRRAGYRKLFDRIAVFAVILGIWEGVVRAGLVHPLFVSQPSAIAIDLWKMMASGFIFGHLALTLYETIAGLAIGTLTGMVFGFLAAISPRISDALQPVLVALHSMPRIAIAPLFIIWFGFGAESKIGLVTLVVFFVTFFNTYSGVESVEPVLINNIRSMGGSQWHVLRMVLIPVTMAWVFAALKTSISNALVGAVVAEFVGSRAGIGWIMVQASGTLNTTRLFATLILLSVVGSLLFAGIRWIEQRLLRWRPNAQF